MAVSGEWLVRASDAGDPEASYLLGEQAAQSGDAESAMNLLQKAAELRHQDAINLCIQLCALMLKAGIGKRTDVKRTLREMQQLAKKYKPVMRFRLSLFLVTALSAPASQAERMGGPIVDLDYQYYTVYGNSTLEIQKSISAQSPLKTRAESFAGKTDWTVRSEYHLVALASGGCRVEAPKVYVTIKIHIPRLRVSTSQSKAVQREWSRYFAALQSHELQHAQTGVKAGGSS